LLASLRSSDHQLALNETEGAPLVVSFHPVNILLNEVECRVLGSSHRKRNHYSRILPALSERPPQRLQPKIESRARHEISGEAAVRQALHSLDGQSLVRSVSASDAASPSTSNRLQEAFNFYRTKSPSSAFCSCGVRKLPATSHPRRTHASFRRSQRRAVQPAAPDEARAPARQSSSRQPGTKESRYAHLLSGDVELSGVVESFEAKPAAETALPEFPPMETVSRIWRRIAALRNEVSDFHKEISDLSNNRAVQKQFE